jgi:serine/threonine protein kinase
VASEIPPPKPPGIDPGGPAAPGDAFERLGILETLSYGVVYDGRLYRASRSEPLAMLELDPAFGQDEDVLARLAVEIENASKLKDPKVLTPRGLYRSGQSLYVLSEAHPGVNLAAAFQLLAILGLRLSAEAVLRVAGAVLAALDSTSGSGSGREEAFYCHGYLIPENIFIAEGQRVLIRGFGLWAGGIGRLKLVGPNEARYLTPSQNRAEAASPRADLFSLGTILFEAVAGVPAFDGAPDEEAVMSLRDSVQELQNQGGVSLQALYGVILSCLNANPPIPSFRSKLKTTVDTLFLGELARERIAKTLSLEELIARVRPRRPAVIKARSLALGRIEAVSEDRPSRVVTAATIPETEPAALDLSATISLAPAEKKAAPTPDFVLPQPVVGAEDTSRRSASSTIWILILVAAVGISVGIALLNMRPRAKSAMTRPTAAALPSPTTATAENVQGWPPASLPTPALLAAATAPPATPEVFPTPDLPLAVRPAERPTSRPKPPEPRKRPAPASAMSRRREAPDRTRPISAGPPASNAAETGSSLALPPPTAVAAGSLVPLEAPGLARPFLTAAPEALRFEPSAGARVVERSVLLQILIDERGRVRANRVLRADRIPPGFGQGVERYLSTLRFQPAQLGGVAVRVWMPYELRFFGP